MGKRIIVLVIGVLAAGLLVASLAGAGGNRQKDNFRANLKGFNEVPAVSTNGSGTLRIRINDEADTISYTLSFGGLNSTSLFAHIHLGQRNVNGGVVAFLCGGGGKPACPAGTGAQESISGVITAADVIGPAAQGIAPGEFEEFVRAIRAGVTYGNVHSMTQPGGELRDQLK